MKKSFGAKLSFVRLLTARFLFGRSPEDVSDNGGRRRHSNTFRRVRGGVLGIALSLMPMVVVFVVANGMISGITVRFLETGTYHLQVVARSRIGLDEMQPFMDDISRLEGVRSVYPEVQGLALLAGGLGHNGVQVRGIDPGMYAGDPGFAKYMQVVKGSFDLSGDGSILIGEKLADSLQISVGDQVRLITTRSARSERFIPKVSRFTVKGIVSSGYRELDSLWVFISDTDALRILPPGEAKILMGVKFDDPFSIEPLAGKLNFVNYDNPSGTDSRESARAPSQTTSPDEGMPEVTPGHGPAVEVSQGVAHSDEAPILTSIRQILDSNWRLYTWFDLERSQYMSFITTRNLLLFIMVLIVIVAAVNISAAMIMLVLEKQEEIAMIKAMGGDNGTILWLFILAGGITGAMGTVIGLTLGSLAAYNVNLIIKIIEKVINGIGYLKNVVFTPQGGYVPLQLFNPDFYLASIPVEMRFSDILIMAAVSLSLSLLMSILPAYRAVRTSPLKLLHRQ